MSKRHRKDSGEDLWHWAERRDLAAASMQETPTEYVPSVQMTSPRQPKAIARVLSVLGLKSSADTVSH